MTVFTYSPVPVATAHPDHQAPAGAPCVPANPCAAAMPRSLNSLGELAGLSAADRARLLPVTEQYRFRTNEYYASLIDWDDPHDPIRKIIVPEREELERTGVLDASEEKRYFAAPGLEHKYGDTAVLLASGVCGGICRFCFRKRLFMGQSEEVVRDIRPALEYIKAHPEITNVLLSGGDPLMLSTARLGSIIQRLRQIRHVQIIRIGSKMLAFNPRRVLLDPSLCAMLRENSGEEKKIYLMTHFNHPREITREAVVALAMMQEAGVIVMNQTPLLRGVNSNPAVLANLFDRLSFIGVHPYYVFQCRPTDGNRHFILPLEEAFRIFEKARAKCSGLAKRARFVMSHATGKVEVVGRTKFQIFMRYHRAAHPDDKGQFMIFASNPHAMWFDDYIEAMADEMLAEQDHRMTA